MVNQKLSLKTRFVKELYKLYAKKVGGSLHNLKHYLRSRKIHIPPPSVRIANRIKKIYTKGNLYYICQPITKKSNKVIIYIHGGAFVSQITPLHWYYINKLTQKTRANIFIPIYPLCTQNYSGCKDTINLLLNMYKDIIKDFKSTKITIMGESAGGQLALTLGQQIKKHKLPKPKNLIAFSPGLSAGHTKKEIDKVIKNEPILPATYIYYGQKWYVKKGDNPKKAIYSPYYGNNKNIGKISIVVGTNEFLYKQNKKFHELLNKKKIKHTFIQVNQMFHAFPIFPIKEATPIFEYVCSLIK